jgi:hypothetical protein
MGTTLLLATNVASARAFLARGGGPPRFVQQSLHLFGTRLYRP